MAETSLKTKYGKIVLLNRGYKGTPDYEPTTQFKVGINQTNDITVNTTALDEPIPIVNTTQLDNCQTADWTETGDASGDAVDNTAGHFLEGTACLDLGKSGNSEVSFGYNKGIGAQIFSAGKRIYVWVYVKDTDDLAEIDAVEIRFGNDTTNYWYTKKDRADLSDGWNVIYIDRTSASSEGSPVDAGCDTLGIEFKTPLAADTITSGDVRMDNWFLSLSTSYAKDFDANYPSIDEDNHEVTLRGTLEVTDAIGFSIQAHGDVNEDATPLLLGADKFKESSKSKDDVFVFIAKDRIV